MLSEKEKEILSKKLKRKNVRSTSQINIHHLNVEYFIQGNFTAAVVGDVTGIIGVGMSKRSVRDKYCEETGKIAAFSKAIDNILPILFI